jgi:hypothetical protein
LSIFFVGFAFGSLEAVGSGAGERELLGGGEEFSVGFEDLLGCSSLHIYSVIF